MAFGSIRTGLGSIRTAGNVGDGSGTTDLATSTQNGLLSKEDFSRLQLMGYVVYPVGAATTDFDLPIPGGSAQGGNVDVLGRIISSAGSNYLLYPDGLTTNQESIAIITNATIAPAVVGSDQVGVLQLGDVTAAGGYGEFGFSLACFVGKQHRFTADCYRPGVKATWRITGDWNAATDPSFLRVHATVGGAIEAGSWFAIRKIGLGPAATAGDPIVAIDETNKTEAIKLSGRAWVTAANDTWGGNVVTRFNHAATVRLINWTPAQLVFEGVSMASPNTNGSLYFSIFVNNVFFASVPAIAISSPVEYTVSGMASGPKTVEIIEGFQARETAFDTGVDGRISTCYVTGVRVPAGQTAPIRTTANTGTIAWGDSILFGIPGQPWNANGWAAQVRASAHAAGQLFGCLGTGAGTLAGDGLTAAQVAANIHDLWAAMGTANKQLIWLGRPNDFKYWDLGGSVHTTPAQLTTFLGAVLDALTASDPGYSALVVAPFIPQGTNQQGPNGGGFTRTDYETDIVTNITTGRLQVTLLDGTSWGLSLATDYSEAAPDQVHPDQSGHDKIAIAIKAALLLP